MWETLGTVAQGVTGFSQGMNQGLDLYEKWSQIKAERDKQARQQAVSDSITNMAKSGELNDPLTGAQKIAGLYLQNGDVENYTKYQQYAAGLQKEKTNQVGMQAYQMSQVDPYGAIDKLNEFNKLSGNGNQFSYTKTPTGVQVHSKGPQGETVIDYDDPMHFQHDVMAYLQPWLIGAKDAALLPGEVAKNEAAAEASKAQTHESEALLPAKEAQLRASAGASVASAANSQSEAADRSATRALRVQQVEQQIAASQAQVEASKAQTAREEALLPLEVQGKQQQVEGSRADVEYKRAATKAIGNDDVSKAVSAMLPVTAALPGEVTPPEKDRSILAPAAQSIKEATGQSGADSVAQAYRYLTSNKLGVDVENGKVREPDGTIVTVGKTAAAIIRKVMIQRQAAAQGQQ